MNKLAWILDLVKSLIISVGGLIGCIYIVTNPECNDSVFPLFAIIAGSGLWWTGFLVGCGYEEDKDEKS